MILVDVSFSPHNVVVLPYLYPEEAQIEIGLEEPGDDAARDGLKSGEVEPFPRPRRPGRDRAKVGQATDARSQQSTYEPLLLFSLESEQACDLLLIARGIQRRRSEQIVG
jgi:hypothetical protein